MTAPRINTVGAISRTPSRALRVSIEARARGAAIALMIGSVRRGERAAAAALSSRSRLHQRVEFLGGISDRRLGVLAVEHYALNQLGDDVRSDDLVRFEVRLVLLGLEAEILAPRRGRGHQIHLGLVFLDDRVRQIGWIARDGLQHGQYMAGRRQQLRNIARW